MNLRKLIKFTNLGKKNESNNFGISNFLISRKNFLKNFQIINYLLLIFSRWWSGLDGGYFGELTRTFRLSSLVL